MVLPFPTPRVGVRVGPSHRRPGYGSATDPHRPDLEGDV